MKVILLEPWMGFPKGTRLDLIPNIAATLITREQAQEDGEGKKLSEPSKTEKEKEEVGGEEDQEQQETEEKELTDTGIKDKEYRQGRNKILKRRR